MSNLTLHICKGLPASGKSTRARKLVAEAGGQLMRVNRDTLREMCAVPHFSKRREKAMQAARDAMIRLFFELGFDVICDDTNIQPGVEHNLRSIAAEFNAEVVVHDFTDVSVEECIRRDKLRGETPKPGRSVGEEVIVGMWLKNLAPPGARKDPEGIWDLSEATT